VEGGFAGARVLDWTTTISSSCTLAEVHPTSTSRTREAIIQRIAELFGDRPVRWADLAHFIGNYDGRDRTLEVFNTDASEQRASLRRMRPMREEIEAIAGGPVVVIFYTRAESARLHSEFVNVHERSDPL